jgi:hypothetical protein
MIEPQPNPKQMSLLAANLLEQLNPKYLLLKLVKMASFSEWYRVPVSYYLRGLDRGGLQGLHHQAHRQIHRPAILGQCAH